MAPRVPMSAPECPGVPRSAPEGRRVTPSAAECRRVPLVASHGLSRPLTASDCLGLQDLLGPTNKRLVTQTMSALADGDIARVGALMVEYQAAFDECAMPMCPSQLTAPNLHKVLGHPTLQPHIWGGKGVGSQGDGCAQVRAHPRMISDDLRWPLSASDPL